VVGDIIWTAHFVVHFKLLHEALIGLTEWPAFAN
jgi:hypothetical protein